MITPITRRAPALAAAGLTIFVAGCGQPTETVNAASPSPMPTRAEWARPNGLTLPYFVRTDYKGKTGAAIRVTINGKEAASLSKPGRVEVTDLLHKGDNQVIVGWVANRGMSADASAAIELGYEKFGAWIPILTERATRQEPDGEKTYRVNVGGRSGDLVSTELQSIKPLAVTGVPSVPPGQIVTPAPPASEYLQPSAGTPLEGLPRMQF